MSGKRGQRGDPDRRKVGDLLQQLRAPGMEHPSSAPRRMELVDELVQQGVLRRGNERAATGLLAALGRCGEWERAVALLRRMEQPNRFSYNAAVSACAKGYQGDHALALLAEMHARGLEPDVVSYSAVISACAKGAQWGRALELLREMAARGLEPDVIAYSAAISACEKGAQWERALELLQAMRARGLEPNVIRCAPQNGRGGRGIATGGGESRSRDSKKSAPASSRLDLPPPPSSCLAATTPPSRRARGPCSPNRRSCCSRRCARTGSSPT